MGIPFLHPWANRLAGFEYAVDGREVRLPHGPPLVHGDGTACRSTACSPPALTGRWRRGGGRDHRARPRRLTSRRIRS